MNNELLKQKSREALEAETVNIIRLVSNGKTLTKSQRERLENQADYVDRKEVLQALSEIREQACEDCAELINQLVENLHGEPAQRAEEPAEEPR